MKLRWITAATLLATLGIPGLRSAQAQENKKREPHRYLLKDLGTFGGPQSNVGTGYSEALLNSGGAVVGAAVTSALNPSAANPNPLFVLSDQFASHAFEWQRGELIDLGVMSGLGANSGAIAINDHGVVVGISENGVNDLLGVPEISAILWRHGNIINLGTLGGNESGALAINEHEQVVGFSQNAISDSISLLSFGTQTRAFLWEEGKMRDLGTLGGPDAFAFFVNDRGQVVGESFTDSTPILHPFLWQDNRMVDLGSLGGTQAYPSWLNNRGQVVGDSNLAGDSMIHPFLWSRGALHDLGTLGGTNGTALWINDEGDVVGATDTPGDQVSHAFLWRNGMMRDLGTLATDACSTAFGINSRGQVVGSSDMCPQSPSPSPRAFLWEDGRMIDLNTFVPPGSLQLTFALNINDHGEIAGSGVLANGDVHAFLLIPCEEHTRDCGDESANNETTTRETVRSAFQTATMLGRKVQTPKPVGAWMRERRRERLRTDDK
jgi:probable HAF family extracellular repeat protein